MSTLERQEMLFVQLVSMFQMAALHQLGKMKNPLTDRIERDLPAAQSTIDMLAMLQEKTRGNLSAEEDRFLSGVLRDLRLNYVDEAAKPEPPAPEQAAS
jgi:hypothetical protein